MNGVDRNGARRLMRIGQAAAVLLAAGAVLAMTVQPGLPSAPVIIADTTVNPEPEAPEPEPLPFDVALVSTVLNEAGGVVPEFPEQDTSIAPPPASEEPIVVPERPTSSSNYRFLGGFFSPTRSLAIIAGGGKQQMVRVGDTTNFGFTIKTINNEFVEIERNGVIERLEREVASGPVVGTTTSALPAASRPDQIAPGTVVSESARDRLRSAREQANQRANADRADRRADYERQRRQRIEELREQGIDVDEMEWRRDD